MPNTDTQMTAEEAVAEARRWEQEHRDWTPEEREAYAQRRMAEAPQHPDYNASTRGTRSSR